MHALGLVGAALAVVAAAGMAPPAKPSFAAVKCWHPLQWTMKVDAAEAALKTAGHKPRREETRGYFRDPGLGPAHTTQIDLVFEVSGWKAAVRFDPAGRMTRIDLSLEKAAEKVAGVELAALEAAYGPPAERTDSPTSHRWVWRNEITRLIVNAVRGADETWIIGVIWVPVPPK